ncbi:pseudouridine synthase RluA family [Firmicutes bacterium CAG:822]|nr:pseudouridine synthase RluA family [Firmicutes bacterium CAG:822]
MINIIYEDNHLLVVEKPINVPVQADKSGDEDLLTMLKKYLKEKYNKPGDVYLGLVHRLDRPVGGVMVFAKTSKAASRLSKQVQKHEFKKIYMAVIEGKVSESGTFKDKLKKDEKTNITRVSEDGKEAELSYNLIGFVNNLSLVRISLKTGRSHQIRVQFASRKIPLYGDQKYNPNAVKDQIALFASKLEFKHPITKEVMSFELPLPERYPFTLFKAL